MIKSNIKLPIWPNGGFFSSSQVLTRVRTIWPITRGTTTVVASWVKMFIIGTVAELPKMLFGKKTVDYWAEISIATIWLTHKSKKKHRSEHNSHERPERWVENGGCIITASWFGQNNGGRHFFEVQTTELRHFLWVSLFLLCPGGGMHETTVIPLIRYLSREVVARRNFVRKYMKIGTKIKVKPWNKVKIYEN